MAAIDRGLDDKRQADEALRIREQETAQKNALLTQLTQSLLEGLEVLKSMPRSRLGSRTYIGSGDYTVYISDRDGRREYFWVKVDASGKFRTIDLSTHKTVHEGTIEETLIVLARNDAMAFCGLAQLANLLRWH